MLTYVTQHKLTHITYHCGQVRSVVMSKIWFSCFYIFYQKILGDNKPWAYNGKICCF